MKFESELITSAPLNPAAQRRAWLLAAVVTTFVMLWLFVWYKETVFSAVAIWMRSETFAHGFLIFPISAYLIWTRRRSVLALRPEPSYWPLLLLGVTGFVWLLAGLADVKVVQQYSLVLMIPLLVWTLLGSKIVWELAFPLLFLLFAVPFGEIFLPSLMVFTADFTVAALQLTGIPVYREGLFFTIPSGQWSVVEGCSGLRYLIASLTLGCLYAYLTYRTVWRRLLFVLLSIVVPIFANGLRAYMIVMIAHLSDMKLALGVDHYLYGWVFFGLVMLLLFWIGSFWREDDKEIGTLERSVPPRKFDKPVPLRGMVIAAVFAMAISALWPGYAAHLEDKPISTAGLDMPVPAPAGGWQAQSAPLSGWRPEYAHPDASIMQTYRKGDQTVSVYLGYYRTQRQGAELITSTNVMVHQKHPVWSKVGEGYRTIVLAGRQERVVQTKLRSPAQRLLVWNWNRIQEQDTVNPYLAKLLLAKTRLFGGRGEGAVIIIAAPYDEQPEEAVPVLQAFLNDMLSSMEASLKDVSHQ